MCEKHYRRHHSRGEYATKPCKVRRCGRGASSAGYCSAHYRQLQRGKRPLGEIKKVGPKGGGYTDGYGYRRIGKRKVHRIVMEGVLGRPLLRSEEVHHKNGNPSDNRPENLELWVRGQPPGQRVSDLVAWAGEILRRYAPDLLKEA